MSGEEFGEELYRENLYFKYEEKSEELQQRIDKAIEYIKNNCDITKSYYPYVDTRYIDTKTLLDILKGEDKE